MATATRFDVFTQDLADGKHNFDTHQMQYILSNAAPTAATDAVQADITEIATGNGYTAGGTNFVTARDPEVAGKTLVKGTDFTIAASGGAIAQFRYVVFLNSTAAGGPLINYYDFGSAQDLADGDSRSVEFNATTGWLELDQTP